MSVSVHFILNPSKAFAATRKQSHNQSLFRVPQSVHKEDLTEETRLWQVTTTESCDVKLQSNFSELSW